MVPRPCSPRRCRARSMTSRTSFTPAVTALSCSNARFVLPATASASVVLPVPGGPQKMALVSRSCSTRRRSGLSGPTRCVLADDVVERAWPQARGQRRLRRRRSSAAALNRSDTPSTVAQPATALRGCSSTRCVGVAAPLGHVVDQPVGVTHCQATNSLPSGCRHDVGRRARRTGTSAAPGRCGLAIRLAVLRISSPATRTPPSRGTRRGRSTCSSPSPVSSISSRHAPSSGSSPAFSPPCGSCQLPGRVGPLERHAPARGRGAAPRSPPPPGSAAPPSRRTVPPRPASRPRPRHFCSHSRSPSAVHGVQTRRAGSDASSIAGSPCSSGSARRGRGSGGGSRSISASVIRQVISIGRPTVEHELVLASGVAVEVGGRVDASRSRCPPGTAAARARRSRSDSEPCRN